jgi:hypothetical protein
MTKKRVVKPGNANLPIGVPGLPLHGIVRLVRSLHGHGDVLEYRELSCPETSITPSGQDNQSVF